jgi:hypothetical protein
MREIYKVVREAEVTLTEGVGEDRGSERGEAAGTCNRGVASYVWKVMRRKDQSING